MNKVYKVIYVKSSSDEYAVKVLASNVGDAYDKATRYLKKNWYSYEILRIEFVLKIDVTYKK